MRRKSNYIREENLYLSFEDPGRFGGRSSSAGIYNPETKVIVLFPKALRDLKSLNEKVAEICLILLHENIHAAINSLGEPLKDSLYNSNAEEELISLMLEEQCQPK